MNQNEKCELENQIENKTKIQTSTLQPNGNGQLLSDPLTWRVEPRFDYLKQNTVVATKTT